MRHPSEILLFLEAKTKEELIKKQFENNLKFQTSFVYTNPMKDGDRWIIWYTANVSEIKRMGGNPLGESADESSRRSRKAKV
jgi:hypothetical protein